MNLTEYKNQPNPQRLSIYSVKVKRSECKQIYECEGGEIVCIDFGFDWFSYFKPKNESGLYALNASGQNRKLSVFYLSEKK